MQADEDWNAVRDIVRRRDKSCRLHRCLTAREHFLFKSAARSSIVSILDPAHVFPKSIYPCIKYDPLNVVLLNRYSHDNIDNLRSPVDGLSISPQEQFQWWKRIVGKDVFLYLLNKIQSEMGLDLSEIIM